MSRKRILILLHAHERPLENSSFIVRHLQREWEARGHTVVVGYGARRPIDADIVINHVDLTVTPRVYRRYTAGYASGVNRRLVDISKDVVSTNLLGRDDRYDGKVLVKTKANAGGARDLALQAQASVRGRIAWKTARWQEARRRDSALAGAWFIRGSEYPIFDSLSEVPTSIWRNRRLVVEKFLATRDDDGNYVLHGWIFFGDRGFTLRTVSTGPIAKGAPIIIRTVLDADPPPEVRAMRQRLGSDYGRIDYGVVDGEVVIYDISRTPTFTEASDAYYRDEIVQLAQGIRAF